MTVSAQQDIPMQLETLQQLAAKSVTDFGP